MKRIISLVIPALSLIIILAGCVRTDPGVKLKNDGTVGIAVTVSIRKDIYEAQKKGGGDSFDGKTAKKITFNNKTYLSYTETSDNLTYDEIESKMRNFTVGGNGSVKLFKSVSAEKNGGLFYNSYTFRATTNVITDNSVDTAVSVNDAYKITIKVTMPGNIAQLKGGTIKGSSVIFFINDLTQENDLAVYSDANNTVTVVIIITVLAIIAAAFLFFIKRKQG